MVYAILILTSRGLLLRPRVHIRINRFHFTGLQPLQWNCSLNDKKHSGKERNDKTMQEGANEIVYILGSKMQKLTWKDKRISNDKQ